MENAATAATLSRSLFSSPLEREEPPPTAEADMEVIDWKEKM